MEFKEFFSMMKNRISDGADVPYFFRDLIAMITDVTEEEWGTPKDPSTKLSKESTLRSYAKDNLLRFLKRTETASIYIFQTLCFMMTKQIIFFWWKERC